MPEPVDDSADLAKLGYSQELLRSIGPFQNFALSFSIISILTGAVTLYGDGLKWGGPLVMTVGWPVVAIFTLFIAASLAELASAFPTAGALYHWASILGGPGAGWATAWLNTLGQFAVTAAIDFGLAQFLAPLLGWEATRAHVLPLFTVILLSHAVLNHFGVRLVSALNTISAWYHVAGVAVVVGAVIVFAPKQPLSFLLTSYTHDSSTLLPGFLIALLQPAWTFTGYDASAHVSEETIDASRNAPKGIMLAVSASAVAGWVMLIAVTLAIQNMPVQAAAENPFIAVLNTSMGSLGTALVWVCVGAMWFCGLASVTSNSRMLYAFARDGGLPFSKRLALVSKRFQSPHVAVWVSVAMAFVIAAWSVDAYNLMAALSTVALYASYALPIWVGLRARKKGWPRRGPWHLGKYGSLVNGIALGWVGFMLVVMSLPPNDKAGLAFSGTLVLLVVAWFGGVRRHFKGPAVHA